jgi:hypothetical protein
MTAGKIGYLSAGAKFSVGSHSQIVMEFIDLLAFICWIEFVLFAP